MFRDRHFRHPALARLLARPVALICFALGHDRAGGRPCPAHSRHPAGSVTAEILGRCDRLDGGNPCMAPSPVHALTTESGGRAGAYASLQLAAIIEAGGFRPW